MDSKGKVRERENHDFESMKERRKLEPFNEALDRKVKELLQKKRKKDGKGYSDTIKTVLR